MTGHGNPDGRPPMTRILLALAMLGLALMPCVPQSVRAAESYDNCSGFITSLPAVISTQGTWCLKQDLATSSISGAAITINTNNVTIDCNDFKLGGLAAGLGTHSEGIFAIDRLNVTVHHCNIRGFLYGVYLGGIAGGGHTIEDNRFDGNTYTGVQVEGDGSVVRRNRISNTGKSTDVVNAAGIITTGSVDVVDNSVSSVIAATGSNGRAYGIFVGSNPAGAVIGNGVRGLVADGTGYAIAFFETGTNYVDVRDNDLVGDGSALTVGLDCQNSNTTAKNNAVNGFAFGLVSCTDHGGNDLVP